MRSLTVRSKRRAGYSILQSESETASPVLEMARRGHALGLTARRTNLLETLRAEIHAACGPQLRVELAALGVCKTDSVAPTLQDLFARLGVVVNAGANDITDIGKGDLAKELSLIETNLSGAIATIDAAATYFATQGAGLIVGVSSLAPLQPIARTVQPCLSGTNMKIIMRALVGIFGVVALAIAIRFWIAPAAMAAQLGFAIQRGLGIATMRADLAGFFGGTGAIALASAAAVLILMIFYRRMVQPNEIVTLDVASPALIANMLLSGPVLGLLCVPLLTLIERGTVVPTWLASPPA